MRDLLLAAPDTIVWEGEEKWSHAIKKISLSCSWFLLSSKDILWTFIVNLGTPVNFVWLIYYFSVLGRRDQGFSQVGTIKTEKKECFLAHHFVLKWFKYKTSVDDKILYLLDLKANLLLKTTRFPIGVVKFLHNRLFNHWKLGVTIFE